MKTFGERVRYYRRWRRMTQAQLGAILGVTGAAVGAIERHLTRKPRVNIGKYAAALGVPVYVLLDNLEQQPAKTTGMEESEDEDLWRARALLSNTTRADAS